MKVTVLIKGGRKLCCWIIFIAFITIKIPNIKHSKDTYFFMDYRHNINHTKTNNQFYILYSAMTINLLVEKIYLIVAIQDL